MVSIAPKPPENFDSWQFIDGKIAPYARENFAILKPKSVQKWSKIAKKSGPDLVSQETPLEFGRFWAEGGGSWV